MKLIVVTGAIHFDKDIEKILDNANIKIYSRSIIGGHSKNTGNNISDNWFAMSNHYQDSVAFFSFTEEKKAQTALEAAASFNHSIPSKSRIRAFILGVENNI